MQKTRKTPLPLARLTDVVLYDIVAALPMEDVMRLMEVSCPRLQEVCSSAWVANRMTDVTFGSVVTEHTAGGEVVRRTLCREVVLRRLRGHVLLEMDRLNVASYSESCLALLKRMPGNVHIYVYSPNAPNELSGMEFVRFVRKMDRVDKVLYCSTKGCGFKGQAIFSSLPYLVFLYSIVTSPAFNYHAVVHKQIPSGRHILDVVRSATRTTVVSASEWDRIKADIRWFPYPAGYAGEPVEGVRVTTWYGAELGNFIVDNDICEA